MARLLDEVELEGLVRCEHCPPDRRAWFSPAGGRDKCWWCVVDAGGGVRDVWRRKQQERKEANG